MWALIRQFTDRIDRFLADRSGTSAVEFAFILPLMVVLYFGCVEVSQAVSANRKISAVAASVGDLIAQATSVDDDAIENIFNAAEAVITPFSAAPLQIVISSVWIDDDGDATVLWSEAQNTTKRAEDSAVTLPDGILVEETSVIMTEVDYVYTSVLADFFSGPIALHETFYMQPRKSATVEGPD